MLNQRAAARRRSGPALTILATVLVAACTTGGGSPAPSGTAAAPSSSAGSPGPSASSLQVPIPSPSGPPAAGAVPDAILNAAIADAAAASGVDAATITVVSAQPNVWNDGSLGCPEPGVLYTQSLVPGYEIVLLVDGKQKTYHASESGTVRPCNGPKLGG